jgi:hypothetical protein
MSVLKQTITTFSATKELLVPRLFLSVLALLLWWLPAKAQGRPGTNLSVDLDVDSLSRSGDTTQIFYLAHNSPNSAEPMWGLTVESPAPPVAIIEPEPADSWSVLDSYGDLPVAHWAWLTGNLARPGQTSPVLSFKAVGLPTIVNAHIQGFFDLIDEDTLEAESPLAVDPLGATSVPVKTVGVEPIPAGSTTESLTSRLEILREAACSLSWITQASLCTTLRGYLTASPARLTSFENDLATGHTAGGPVSDNAYWLLKTNADHIISLNPGPATSILTWVPPAPIVLGTPLGASQLNASAASGGANVSGTFTYTPLAGTVLSVGAGQTLSVAFTPNDQSSYTGASKSVTIDVVYNPSTGHQFLQPINTPPQERSVFHLGSTVPVKFDLYKADGVTAVTTASATIQVNRVSNGAPNPVNETVYSTVPDQGANFRFTSGHYQFNLGTGNLSTGTYRITAILDDGSRITQDIELRSN